MDQVISWKQSFEQALQSKLQHLLRNDASITPNDLYEQYCSMSSKQRWGLWKEVSIQMKTTNRQVQNYFHNTWCKQFYINTYTFKDEISKILKEQLSIQPANLVNQQTVYQFIKNHEEIVDQINIHQLQQVVGLLKSRMTKYTKSAKVEQKKPIPQFVPSFPTSCYSNDTFRSTEYSNEVANYDNTFITDNYYLIE